MTKVKDEPGTALAHPDPVIAKLLATGFAVERVDPKASRGDAESMTDIEENVVEMLMRDGYTSAQDAFNALVGTFGIARYADKATLANDGTIFAVQKIVQRIAGGYKGGDDWALQIVTEDGEPQTLTMESNPKRDRFLYTLAFLVQRMGSASATLQAVQKQNGDTFYVVGPPLKPIIRNVTPDEAVTYEGETV